MEIDTQFDLVIIGGGLVGASLACTLADTSLKVAVVEKHVHSELNYGSYDDRSVALAYGTRVLFENIGLWSSISKNAEKISSIHISQRGRLGVAQLDHQQLGVAALGYVIENRLLGQALYQRLQAASNIKIISPALVTGITQKNGQRLTAISLDNINMTIQSKLVIAADGAESSVRKWTVMETSEKDYQQTAIICNVTPEYPHNNIAYERFTDAGPLAFLPLPDFVAGEDVQSRCSVVWTVSPSQADSIMKLPDAEFLQQLQACFGLRLGTLQRTGQRTAYPLKLVQVKPGATERIALVGNAAHTLHPVAGQGFNLGVRDVMTLAELLLEAGLNGFDIGGQSILQRYQQARQRDYKRVIRSTDTLALLFTYRFKPVQLARSAGMLLLDVMPGVSTMLARRAMGLSGRMPRLNYD